MPRVWATNTNTDKHKNGKKKKEEEEEEEEQEDEEERKKKTHQVFVAVWGVGVVSRGREVGKGACQLEGTALPGHPLTHKGWLEGAFLHTLILSSTQLFGNPSVCSLTHALVRSPMHSSLIDTFMRPSICFIHSPLTHTLTHSVAAREAAGALSV